MINVTIWNEFRHEKEHEAVREIYPNGIHVAIGEALKPCEDLVIRYATLDDPDQGLPDEVLNTTDVLMWWGHMHHGDVKDELVAKIRDRVYNGMGFIALHSAHDSKPFHEIVGTNGVLQWGDDRHEVIWNINPTHPIAAGIPAHFSLPLEELYAEPFRIPKPDDLIFVGWYEGGYVFRSGCTFTRGVGKVVYLQPGHEMCRSFYDENVIRILQNAVHWAAPAEFGSPVESRCNYTNETY